MRKRFSEKHDLVNKNDKKYGKLQDPVDIEDMKEIHKKAKATFEFLCDYMMINEDERDDSPESDLNW